MRFTLGMYILVGLFGVVTYLVWYVLPLGGANNTNTQTAQATPAAGTVVLPLANYTFNPGTLEIPAGTTVIFHNSDPDTHSVTSDNGAFPEGLLQQGQDYKFTFNTVGDFPYFCKFHGAKGGVGTTTISINAAIALHREVGRSRVCLVDGNLQFGDHRVFLDLGLDRKSIVDVVTATSIDQELLRSVVVKHDSGVDLLLAPPSPETAELVSADQHHMARIIEQLRQMYDYVVIDIDKRLDENNLDVIASSDIVFVVMTADLSCLKNVRLVLETMTQLNVDKAQVQLVLNRSNAFTGINVKNAEGALKRKIDYQIVNEYRGAISALNSGAPFMFTKADSLLGRSVLEFARSVDRGAVGAPAGTPQLAPVTG